MVTGAIILLAALAGAPDAAAIGQGCAAHWLVSLDEESFANNGAGKRFAADELAAFSAEIDSAIRRAVGEACDAGSIDPRATEMVRDVLVHSASGATEPHIYAAGDRALHFEWVFAEEDLAIPSDPEIANAVACWIEPSGPSCPELGD